MMSAPHDNRLAWVGVGAMLVIPLTALAVIAAVGDGDRGGVVGAAPGESSEPETSDRSPIAPVSGTDPISRARRLARRDPAGARAVLRAALEERPDDERVLEALAMKLLADENHREARELVLRCLRLNPENAGCQKARRHLLDPDKRHDNTTPFLENCLRRDTTDEACLAAAVVDAVRSEDEQKAAGYAERLRRAHPDSPMMHLSEGRIQSLEGNYAAALKSFEAACEAKQEYGCFRAQALREEGW